MKSEKKKLIPAISVFVFVVFSFVIAKAFGDTYAASCPSGYIEISSVCCLEGASGYDSVSGRCAAVYDSDTNSCPNDKWKVGSTGNGAQLAYFCWAEPVEKIDNEPTTTAYTVTLIADGVQITGPDGGGYGEYVVGDITTFDYASYKATTNTENGEFSGWSESINLTNCKKTGTKTLTESITLYACYSGSGESTSYTVTLNPNGGTWGDGTTSNKSKTYTDKLSFDTLSISKSGCSLEGWKTSSGKLLTSYADSAETGQTLTASWNCDSSGGDNTDTTNYTITFYNELSKKISSTTVVSGEKISSSKLPSFKYNQLAHFWSGSSSCSTEFDLSSSITANMNLYQCYSEGFMVSFYDGERKFIKEVEIIPSDMVIPSNQIPSKPNVSKQEGYWSEYDTCDLEFDFSDIIIEDMDLYACYYYDISFYKPNETDNYEKISSTKFVQGSKLYDLGSDLPGEDDLLISGKVFTHWSTVENSCEENNKLDIDEVLPNEEVKLYACYVDGEAVVVTFNGKDGNKVAEMQVVKGTSINDTVEKNGVKIPTAPTIDGYTFKYWSSGSNCSKSYDFNSIVNDKLTLTACYDQTANSGDESDIINPGTGSFMLYIVYVIGICSLIYTGYSIYRLKKNNN